MFALDDPKQVLSYEAKLSALRKYRPRPLAAPIVLPRVREQPISYVALDSTLGWRELAPNGVRVHVVPGSHGRSPPSLSSASSPTADDGT